MRDNTTPELVSAVSAHSVTTAIMARLEFKSETLFVWTGNSPLQMQPGSTGDWRIDGNTFEPIAHGVMVEIGENTFTMTGSNELQIVLNIPDSPGLAVSASQVYPAEYQSRPAMFWRAIMVSSADPTAKPTFLIRPIRAGRMDKVEIQGDGNSHKFMLTIESHQSLISNASNQTYLNQRDYDPSDSSQDFAPSIANGDPAPSKGVTYGGSGLGGGGYGGSADQMGLNFMGQQHLT